MPVGMVRPQAVMIGEKVYMGGGAMYTDNIEDNQQVFWYDPFTDEWNQLPPCLLVAFAMAQFMGSLITVGGSVPSVGAVGKVYRFKEQSQKWEEFPQTMPTARFLPSVATTQSTIAASGGCITIQDSIPVPCAAVEVYSSETSHWYTADPLPVPCGGMTSVTIADTWYLLGGGGTDDKDLTTVLYASLTTLIQRATSPTHQSASPMSVWKTLPDTPLKLSAAASLSGYLLALGGYSDKTPASSAVRILRHFLAMKGRTNKTSVSQALHIFLPFTNSWVKATTCDLPEPSFGSTVVQLSSNRLLVIGGWNSQSKRTSTVFLGSIVI